MKVGKYVFCKACHTSLVLQIEPQSVLVKGPCRIGGAGSSEVNPLTIAMAFRISGFCEMEPYPTQRLINIVNGTALL